MCCKAQRGIWYQRPLCGRACHHRSERRRESCRGRSRFIRNGRPRPSGAALASISPRESHGRSGERHVDEGRPDEVALCVTGSGWGGCRGWRRFPLEEPQGGKLCVASRERRGLERSFCCGQRSQERRRTLGEARKSERSASQVALPCRDRLGLAVPRLEETASKLRLVGGSRR